MRFIIEKMTPEEKRNYMDRLLELKDEKKEILAPVSKWGNITFALAIVSLMSGSFLVVGGMALSIIKFINEFASMDSDDVKKLKEIDREIRELKSSRGR